MPEYVLPKDYVIISRTDLKGLIVDCNDEFIEVSGFDKCELFGFPHSTVRHPDMPKEAFRDLWATLKGKKPWSGIVKNRRRNGDYYWVKATVTPLPDDSGYMSVRIQATKEQINFAENLYKKMNLSNGIGLQNGKVVHKNIFKTICSPITKSWNNSLKLRIMSSGLIIGLIILSSLIGVSLFSSAGIKESSVDGKQFTKIIKSKDLLADILPLLA